MHYIEQQQSENKNPFDILKHFHSQVRIAEHASDADTGLTKMYLEGVEEENLEKIYHFVHSVEIGCGFTPNPMLDNAFSDAYNQDSEKAFHTIDSRPLSVVEAICLLYCMSIEQIIYYIDSLTPKNSVLLFEAIRGRIR